MRRSIAGVCVLALAGMACQQSLPDPSRSKEQLRKALLDAVEAEKLSDVRKLLDQGADPNAIANGTHYEDTALTLACKHANAAMIDALLEKGADPNRRQSDAASTQTPLILAAYIGRVDIINSLLRAGALPDARAGLLHAQEGGDDVGASSALSAAAQGGHAEVAQLLILAGARIERVDLEVAIVTGHIDVARLLLRAGADPRWTLRDGRTVLQTAEVSPLESRAKMVALVRRFLNPPARSATP